jgi:hypothetical protein
MYILFKNEYDTKYASIIRPDLPPYIEPYLKNNKLVGIYYTYELSNVEESNFLKNLCEKKIDSIINNSIGKSEKIVLS